jgi:low affinity Fe/Cu permease
MTRAVRTLIAAVLASAALLGWPAGTASAAEPDAPVVVLVLAPSLTWDDVTPGLTPTLHRLAKQGAIGNLNARSRARRIGDEPSPLEGALTVSAGVWALPAPGAPAAYDYDEPYEFDTAGQAFQRATGESAEGNRIVFLGMPTTERYNRGRSFDVELGALGRSVVDAGGATAAIGNSDIGYATAEQRLMRPAALAAMDDLGRVRFGTVGETLLLEDAEAPFGRRTDMSRMSREIGKAFEQLGGAEGPGLLVLDPGDPIRASRWAPLVADGIAQEQRERGVQSVEELVSAADEQLPEDGVLIVAAESLGEPESAVPEGLGPLIVSGPGWEGVLTSASTQQTGIVTNLDITATIIDELGLEIPIAVVGSPMTAEPVSESVDTLMEKLSATNDSAVALETVKTEVVNGYVAWVIIFLLVSTFVILRWRHWRAGPTARWAGGLMVVALGILSVPPASWLMYAIVRYPRAPALILGLFVGSALIVWAVALLFLRRTSPRVAVAFLALGESVLLLVDQWLGGPLSFANFLGYSPLPAARFYGMGNEAAALLFGASIAGLALLFDEYPSAPLTAWAKRWGIPLIGAVVVLTSALPFLGANVGVAVWGTVGFALFWWLVNGHAVTWRLLVVVGVLAALVLVASAAIDLVLDSEAQTHFGRALQNADEGGIDELWSIITRKAATNLRVLTHTNWAFVLAGVLAFLAFMRFRPAGDFADTLRENPAFADAISASLVAGLAAFLTEDSGIVIPALVSLYIGVGVVYLMLVRIRAPGASSGASRDIAESGVEA